MIIHENRLLADDSHEMSYLIFLKIRKDVEKFVVCCSRDWCFTLAESMWNESLKYCGISVISRANIQFLQNAATRMALTGSDVRISRHGIF